MSDRARYFLEQTIPEMEDMLKKGLIDKNEIRMIVKKRTDFEHQIDARKPDLQDYLSYIEFEVNLDKLRRKRRLRLIKIKKLSTKPSISDWSISRRIFFIYERALKTHNENVDLWLQYLNYAKSQHAFRVVYKTYSRMLKLHMRNVNVWISAAKYEFEKNLNAKGARMLFHNGIAINYDSLKMWCSYAHFELLYISKILARIEIVSSISQDQNKTGNDNVSELDLDKINIPEIEDTLLAKRTIVKKKFESINKIIDDPVLNCNVINEIFDSSVSSIIADFTLESRKKKLLFEISESFLRLFDSFKSLNIMHLYNHVLNRLKQSYSSSTKTVFLEATLPIRVLKISDASFSTNLTRAVEFFVRSRKNIVLQKKKKKLTALFTDYLNETFILPNENKKNLNDLLHLMLKITDKLKKL